jgi:addiction module HigA family antidote
MLNTQESLPDYAVSPGEVLQEELAALGMSQTDLQQQTGIEQDILAQLMNGQMPITPEIAIKLEMVLNIPAHLWTRLEQQYQVDRVYFMVFLSKKSTIYKKINDV